MNAHLRLLLSGALALLLLTCTVAAWAAPHASPSGTTSPSVAGAAVSSEPCDLVIGPAHDYCTRGPGTAATVAGPFAAATVVPTGMDGRIGLMLFATAAIGGALGLVLAFERRSR
ncbi:hypothetical protein [Streptomyces sp. R33]|uniref:Uncharacterized protein n=1 Tax=Streptomyces sp. R33 TaxID=3238629 RepID=A0AB39XW95_9ACTN